MVHCINRIFNGKNVTQLGIGEMRERGGKSCE